MTWARKSPKVGGFGVPTCMDFSEAHRAELHST